VVDLISRFVEDAVAGIEGIRRIMTKACSVGISDLFGKLVILIGGKNKLIGNKYYL
jgi:hypothetical protein